MKTLLRIAAGLSFIFPFLCGVWLLIAGIFSRGEPPGPGIPIAIGSFLVGNAIFVGGILLFAAEKLGRKDGSK